LNENFFEVIDTQEKAYWLGFIAADGCVYYDGNSRHLSINQSIKDKDHLEKLRKTIGYEKELYHHIGGIAHTEMVRLRIASKKLYYDLISHGVVPRKTFILKSPINISDEMIRHWIRGYFDGDGCINIRQDGRNERVTILGTEDVMMFIDSQFDFGGIIKPRKNIYLYHLNKRKHIDNFRDFIYSDSVVALERKQEKFFN
jgi:intein/homing endonuclease